MACGSAGALWRLVALQKRYALNSGNVVGQDFGPSAGFGVFSLNAGYAISKQVKLSLGVTTCSTRPTPST